MMHFIYAKHLKKYISDNCSGNCSNCRWGLPDGTCLLLKKVMKPDYGWVPCKERLPELDGIHNVKLLITVKKGTLRIVKKANIVSASGDPPKWIALGTGEMYEAEEPLAWMPCPEPYEGDNDEKDSNNSDIGGDTAD